MSPIPYSPKALRLRGLAMMSLGGSILLVWYYSGFLGQLLRIPNVDPSHYPCDISTYPYVSIHWPLQVLLPLGVLLFLAGLVVQSIDLAGRFCHLPITLLGKRGFLVLLIALCPWGYVFYFYSHISPVVRYEFGSAVFPMPLLFRMSGVLALFLTLLGLSLSVFDVIRWLKNKPGS